MRYIFETERLGFREWSEDDLVPFADMNASMDVMEFFPSTLTKEESRLMMARLQNEIIEKGYGLWAVDIRQSKNFAGFIGLHEATFDSNFTPCVEIGWRLVPEVWGKGIASEGAKASLGFGFRLGLKEIYSFTSVHNFRSERVMQKIGMTKLGEFDHPKVPEGNWLRRHVLYRISGKSNG